MKRGAEYKIVFFLLITGLILTLPARAQSLTGVSTVAEAVSSSKSSLERLTGLEQLLTSKTPSPSVITANGTKVMNVTIPEEVLYSGDVEVLSYEPWEVTGFEDPVAEEVADRKEYLVDSVFPYGLDNGPELNNILIRTFGAGSSYSSSSDIIYMPDLYTEDFDDEEVDDFLLESIGYAVWDNVLSQEDKEEYLRIEEESYMSMVEENIYLRKEGFGRTREISRKDMNNIFEDNTCWYAWVYDPESKKVEFKLGVNEETFTRNAGFQSLSEDKQEEFLELWQEANAEYKEDMLASNCRNSFANNFCSYVKYGKSVADSTAYIDESWKYERSQLMSYIFSRFGAEDGYTYVYEYTDTNEITRYQAELVEKDGYILPDNPVLDE